MNAFVRPESMEVPEGGLASFLTATVGEWADDETFVPQSGIGNVKSVADKLAEYGRYEDTYMVHAAEGETVVPMAVFDENPRLKETLFKQMRAMGIDPEQYVVGSEFNSLNPVTGQPEFFLKKLFKGLKKAVKSVVKVVKKIAPLVLSVGLNVLAPGLGTIAAASIGSGIGTLVQGGSLKDALKMGAIGGLTAGLFKGVQGGIQGAKAGTGFGEGFTSGLKAGLPPPPATASVTQGTASGVGEIARTPVGTSVQGIDAGTALAAKREALENTIRDSSIKSAADAGTALAAKREALGNAIAGSGTEPVATDVASRISLRDPSKFTFSDVPATDTVTSETFKIAPPVQDLGNQVAMDQLQPPKFMDSVKDIFASSGDSPLVAAKKAFFPSTVSPQDVVAERLGMDVGASVSEVATEAAARNLSYDKLIGEATKALASAEGYNPNMLRQYGPLAGASLGILGLTGGFEAPEMDAPVDPFNLGGQGAFDLLAANPDQYRIFSQGGPYAKRPYGAAKGGSITNFPPKIGAISGPGTGTSDDVPAMLSDGEFVMTARAVNGAGNGNRQRGMKKMYEVMRTFEGVA